MRIRAYAMEDFDACRDLLAHNTPAFFAVAEKAEYDSYLQRLALGRYWVVETEGVGLVAGGGIIWEGNGAGSLCWTIVHPDFQGEGIGSRLDDDLTKILLNTSQHTADFFGRFGFSTVRVQPDGYGPGLHRHEMEMAVDGRRDEFIRKLFRR